MTTYRRFVETNDWEGETWTFWLQVDGNMTALAILGDVLDALNEDLVDVEFSLKDDEIDELTVETLVRYGESGYMHQHNKVSGSLSLPECFASMDFDAVTTALYKGGIEKLFTGGAE